MERVLEFQTADDGSPSTYSWATLGSNFTLLEQGLTSLTALSICLRAFMPFFSGEHSLFTLSVDETILYISMGKFI